MTRGRVSPLIARAQEHGLEYRTVAAQGITDDLAAVIDAISPGDCPGSSTKGRKLNGSISEQTSLSVQQFVQSCSTKDWRLYNVRETTRGLTETSGVA